MILLGLINSFKLEREKVVTLFLKYFITLLLGFDYTSLLPKLTSHITELQGRI